MRKLLVSLSLILMASLVCAQELGSVWFVEKGHSQPVAIAPVFRVDDLFGQAAFDVDVSLLVRPLDGLRVGGAITGSGLIAKNLRLVAGVGGLFGDRFEWGAVRPGLIVGFTVVLGQQQVATVSLRNNRPAVEWAVRF